MPRKREPLGQRLERLIRKTPTCWFLPMKLTPKGYAEIKHEGKMWRGHRLTYTFFVGPIPAGLVLDHICKVTACVNPTHLRAVTQRDNVVLNSTNQVARFAAAEACVNGHPFNNENTYNRPSGGRTCRECSRIKGRGYDQKPQRKEAHRIRERLRQRALREKR